MADETTFQDAVDALRQGNRTRAKDLLTQLIQSDQNNPTYWVWMSAAVDSSKERIYCLQTALKLDPQSGTAKRGLVMLGALPPDETVQPFALNRPRAWEQNLLLDHEQPKQKGVSRITSNPILRLAGLLVIGTAVFGYVVYGFLLPHGPGASPLRFNTPGPSPTYTLTPTFVNSTPRITPTHFGPTPLAVLFNISYTPTAMYVNTPRAPISQDIYRGAKTAFERHDWDEFIRDMKEIAKNEPQAADAPYFVGEGYRFKGECRQSLEYYNAALKIDNRFAPAYLGLARARICLDPGADVRQLYELALQSDPGYGEVYLDRANYSLVREDPNAALIDLDKAARLLPNNALVQVALARAYSMKGDGVRALDAAKKANEIDKTLLAGYYVLGQASIANQNYKDAIEPLVTFLIYEPDDASAHALLGRAYAKTGAYQPAVDEINQALDLDPSQKQSRIYRGLAYLALGSPDNAEVDFKAALEDFPDSFDANIGLTQAFFTKEEFGSAYLQSETSLSKATNDTEKALAIYWRALSQEKRGNRPAAVKDWQTLLSMPERALTPQMRNDAETHLRAVVTATSTPKGGTKTPTPSPTKKP